MENEVVAVSFTDTVRNVISGGRYDPDDGARVRATGAWLVINPRGMGVAWFPGHVSAPGRLQPLRLLCRRGDLNPHAPKGTSPSS